MIPLEKKVTSQSIEPRSIPWKPSPIRQNDDEENHHHLEIRIFRPSFLSPPMRTEVESERRFWLEKRKENKTKEKRKVT